MHEIIVSNAVLEDHMRNVFHHRDELEFSEDYVELFLEFYHEIHKIVHFEQNYYFESIARFAKRHLR